MQKILDWIPLLSLMIMEANTIRHYAGLYITAGGMPKEEMDCMGNNRVFAKKESDGINLYIRNRKPNCGVWKVWLKRFLCYIPDRSGRLSIMENVIAANTFAYDETLKVVVCMGKDDKDNNKVHLKTVEEDAFKESGLNVFCCADIDKANESGVELFPTDTSSKDTLTTGTLTIQHNAFLNCHELHTVILPQVSGTLRIEKDAFAGCGKLRTVVIPVKEKGSISISPDAFSGCRNVMFASNNKDVVSFARGQGFGYVGL